MILSPFHRPSLLQCFPDPSHEIAALVENVVPKDISILVSEYVVERDADWSRLIALRFVKLTTDETFRQLFYHIFEEKRDRCLFGKPEFYLFLAPTGYVQLKVLVECRGKQLSASYTDQDDNYVIGYISLTRPKPHRDGACRCCPEYKRKVKDTKYDAKNWDATEMSQRSNMRIKLSSWDYFESICRLHQWIAFDVKAQEMRRLKLNVKYLTSKLTPIALVHPKVSSLIYTYIL